MANTTEQTFNAGDKVKIVACNKPSFEGTIESSIEPGMENSWVHGSMDKYDGEEAVIKERIEVGGYRLEGLPFGWLPEWLELVARAEEPYAPGTEVELIAPAPGLNDTHIIHTTRTIAEEMGKIENGWYRYTVVEDDFLYHSYCFKPVNKEKEVDMNTSGDTTTLTKGDTVRLLENTESDGTLFEIGEMLTVIAIHEEVGVVVFQDKGGCVGITTLKNVEKGDSLSKPYIFKGDVEFDGCFDLDDEMEINTTTDFDKEYNLVSGREYKITVRIEEKNNGSDY